MAGGVQCAEGAGVQERGGAQVARFPAALGTEGGKRVVNGVFTDHVVGVPSVHSLAGLHRGGNPMLAAGLGTAGPNRADEVEGAANALLARSSHYNM